MPGPGVPSLCSEHAFGYSLYVLRVGGPGSSRSRTLLYTFGAQHPALENKAVTAQPTAHVEPKLEAFLLLEVWAGCSTLPSQHPLPGFDHSTGFPKCSSQDHTASCLPPPRRPPGSWASVSQLGCIRPPLASLSSAGTLRCLLALAMQYPASGRLLNSIWLRPLSFGVSALPETLNLN